MGTQQYHILLVGGPTAPKFCHYTPEGSWLVGEMNLLVDG